MSEFAQQRYSSDSLFRDLLKVENFTFWNTVDWLRYLTIITVVSMNLVIRAGYNIFGDWNRALNAIATFLLYLQIIYFLRLHDDTSKSFTNL